MPGTLQNSLAAGSDHINYLIKKEIALKKSIQKPLKTSLGKRWKFKAQREKLKAESGKGQQEAES